MKRYFFTFFLLFAAVAIMAQERVYTPTLKSPNDSSANEMPNVTLIWNAITGSTGLQYELEFDTTLNFNSPLKHDTMQVLLTGYKTRNLLFGQVYYWRVRAIDQGQTSFWSPARSFTIFNYLEPNTPAPTDTAYKTPDVAITWKPTIKSKTITGVANYDYQVDTAANFSSPLLVSGSTNSNTFSYKNFNLRFNTYYFWRVRARHSASSSAWPSSWTLQKSSTSNNLNRIYFKDANNGYSVGNSGTILKSINAGIKWNVQTSTTTKNLTSCHFITATTGYVVGESGTILKTTNGGTLWTILNSQTNKNLASVYFQAAAVGFTVGDSGAILKYVSDTYWKPLLSGTTLHLASVHFPSASIGYAVGDSGKILKYVNDTTPWTSLSCGTTKDLKAVYFVNTLIGFAVGKQGTILKTADGGTNWSPMTSGTTNDLFSVHFFNAKTGFAVGANGTFLKTTNGGSYWATIETGTSANLNSVYFPSASNGFVCGDGGIILNTTVSGMPWSFRVINNINLTEPKNKSKNQFINVTLKWNNISGLLSYGYVIARDPNFTEIVFESELDTNFVKASFLSFGTKYYWRVKGRHLTDTTAWDTVYNFTTINKVLLKSPDSSGQNVVNKPLLVWNSQTGIIGYQLQLDSTSSFSAPIVDYKPVASDVQYQVSKKLNSEQTYYWRMRAFSNGGLTADTTDWSSVWSFTVAKPTGVLEENSNSALTIYPNPAFDKIYVTIETNETKVMNFSLLDLLGKSVLEKSIPISAGKTTQEISLNNIGKGIYIGRMTMGNKVINQKIVVDK